ncbi:RecX family transcriptional regulator [Fusibacter tunisiensis]|uniref:Regulatory protein RecX n=1 Tax=Fusibacter tunisiensis TaxID=1008308 RepID=A0ABS2MRY3_9FIRM|nr:regulatory protein [Fusibacter tunisiensis]
MSQKEYEKWLNYALYLLTLKMRTEAEVKRKLNEKQVEVETQRLVLAFLNDNGLLDDVAFARLYIEANANRYGAYRLRAYLNRKGVSERDQEAAFESADIEASPEARARHVLSRKVESLNIDWNQVSNDYAYRNKVYGKLARFLAGRGFSSDIVKTVVRERLSHEFFDEF